MRVGRGVKIPSLGASGVASEVDWAGGNYN